MVWGSRIRGVGGEMLGDTLMKVRLLLVMTVCEVRMVSSPPHAAPVPRTVSVVHVHVCTVLGYLWGTGSSLLMPKSSLIS